MPPAFSAAARKPSTAAGGVQPRVVAELGALRQHLGDPAGRSFLDQIARLEQLGVGLLADLQACSGRRRTRPPCRVSTTAAPAEPVKEVSQASRSARLGDILALMLVGARHDEAVEAAPVQLVAQGGEPRRAGRRVGFVFVGLEGSGFVHGLSLLLNSSCASSKLILRQALDERYRLSRSACALHPELVEGQRARLLQNQRAPRAVAAARAQDQAMRGVETDNKIFLVGQKPGKDQHAARGQRAHDGRRELRQRTGQDVGDDQIVGRARRGSRRGSTRRRSRRGRAAPRHWRAHSVVVTSTATGSMSDAITRLAPQLRRADREQSRAAAQIQHALEFAPLRQIAERRETQRRRLVMAGAERQARLDPHRDHRRAAPGPHRARHRRRSGPRAPAAGLPG